LNQQLDPGFAETLRSGVFFPTKTTRCSIDTAARKLYCHNTSEAAVRAIGWQKKIGGNDILPHFVLSGRAELNATFTPKKALAREGSRVKHIADGDSRSGIFADRCGDLHVR
jgi:hypothetical protein